MEGLSVDVGRHTHLARDMDWGHAPIEWPRCGGRVKATPVKLSARQDKQDITRSVRRVVARYTGPRHGVYDERITMSDAAGYRSLAVSALIYPLAQNCVSRGRDIFSLHLALPFACSIEGRHSRAILKPSSCEANACLSRCRFPCTARLPSVTGILLQTASDISTAASTLNPTHPCRSRKSSSSRRLPPSCASSGTRRRTSADGECSRIPGMCEPR
jgi:hypothetical protein